MKSFRQWLSESKKPKMAKVYYHGTPNVDAILKSDNLRADGSGIAFVSKHKGMAKQYAGKSPGGGVIHIDGNSLHGHKDLVPMDRELFTHHINDNALWIKDGSKSIRGISKHIVKIERNIRQNDQ